MSGVYELPWGIKVAPIIQAASARPYNSLQGIDVFGYGRNIAHAILLKTQQLSCNVELLGSASQDLLGAGTCFQAPYDALRGQPFFQWDMRFTKEFHIRERARLDFFFQAFDLTNRAISATITMATSGIRPSSSQLVISTRAPQFCRVHSPVKLASLSGFNGGPACLQSVGHFLNWDLPVNPY